MFAIQTISGKTEISFNYKVSIKCGSTWQLYKANYYRKLTTNKAITWKWCVMPYMHIYGNSNKERFFLPSIAHNLVHWKRGFKWAYAHMQQPQGQKQCLPTDAWMGQTSCDSCRTCWSQLWKDNMILVINDIVFVIYYHVTSRLFYRVAMTYGLYLPLCKAIIPN